MEKIRLQAKHLSFSYGSQVILDDIAFKVHQGEFVGIIGPNGSGKSTLLKTVYRGITPTKGELLLDGEDLLSMSYRKSAQKMAVVGQENDVPFDFLVEEIVAMGRNPHKRMLESDNKKDKEIIYHALERLGLQNEGKRHYRNLSGGEKQRVIIARAIAQESDIYILDEPTNHLDISYQIQIFDFIKRLNITVLSAIHDLNLAALYCDYLYVIKGGKIFLDGTPDEILTEKNIMDIYGVRSVVTKHSISERVSITFLPDHIYESYQRRMESEKN